MMSQNPRGELVIGDSYEYGQPHDPFLREDINAHILDYLRQFARMPSADIVARWAGIYAKCTDGSSEWGKAVDAQTTLVNGLGGLA